MWKDPATVGGATPGRVVLGGIRKVVQVASGVY